MASKKYTLVLALLGLMQTAAFAQNDASDAFVFDSSKVSVKNMPQYNEFSKNQYPYPARPRDQWELGGAVGLGFVVGDRALFGKSINSSGGSYLGGITGNITLRKSLGHVFSLRGGYYGSVISMPSTNYGNPSGGNPDELKWSQNEAHMLGLDVIASLNTISHYRGDPKTNIYVMLGYDLIATRVKTINAGALHTRFFPQEANIIGTFGTASQNGRKAWALMHGLDYGAGIAFKLSPKFNLAMEERITMPMFGNDFLDGYERGNSNDVWSYSTLRLNMNLGSTATRVEPLWWRNPNNYVYNEVNIAHHQQPKPVILPDADGDGITDQFDLEPNTPAGAAVDSHGRALDTDGDGVPDYKDKEKLTPMSCFPVNADGVGTCPEPACCTELRNAIKNLTITPPNACTLSSLPSVTFKAGSAKLSNDAQNILAGAAAQLKANANCNVKVVGYVANATSKREQQLSWDRVNAVIKYLVEKQGINEGRIIFSYGNGGDINSVDLQPTTETGPNTVPAPNPQYRTTK